MNMKNIKDTLHRFSEQDLVILKRFLEIVIRQYNFQISEKTENTKYFNIDVRTIETADLPIEVVRGFVYILSEHIENFINTNSLHKEDYDNFQKYKKYREGELQDAGEELGYSEKEIQNEVVNNFDGIFIKNPNNNFIKLLEETMRIIDNFKNKISITSGTNPKQRVFIFDDKLGLFDPVNEKNKPYPIKKTRNDKLTGSYKLINHFCSNDKVVLSKLHQLMNTKDASNIVNRIQDINKRFSRTFGEKDSLIVHLGTGGYSINEKFKLEKQQKN